MHKHMHKQIYIYIYIHKIRMYINICVCIYAHIQCEVMSSPVAVGGYQPLFEPSGLTVKPLSLSPEARDMLLHE